MARERAEPLWVCRFTVCLSVVVSARRKLDCEEMSKATPVPSAEELKAAAETAVEHAAAEGLELMRSETASSGFLNVVFTPGNAAKPWKAMVRPLQGGPQVRIANFSTKEEAALAIARHYGKDGQEKVKAQIAEKTKPPPTAAEIAAQMQAEGLQLIPDTNDSGYKGVQRETQSASRPWGATLHKHGRKIHCGHYATAQEAALAYARRLRQETGGVDGGHVDALASRQLEAGQLHRLDAAGVRQLAEEEGVELVAGDGQSRFQGVIRNKRKTRRQSNRPYQAYDYLGKGRRRVAIGFPCALPEQAALLLARHRKAEAEATAEGRGDAFVRQLLEASAELEEVESVVEEEGDAAAAEEEGSPSRSVESGGFR